MGQVMRFGSVAFYLADVSVGCGVHDRGPLGRPDGRRGVGQVASRTAQDADAPERLRWQKSVFVGENKKSGTIGRDVLEVRLGDRDVDGFDLATCGRDLPYRLTQTGLNIDPAAIGTDDLAGVPIMGHWDILGDSQRGGSTLSNKRKEEQDSRHKKRR